MDASTNLFRPWTQSFGSDHSFATITRGRICQALSFMDHNKIWFCKQVQSDNAAKHWNFALSNHAWYIRPVVRNQGYVLQQTHFQVALRLNTYLMFLNNSGLVNYLNALKENFEHYFENQHVCFAFPFHTNYDYNRYLV